jgi:ribosomal protein S18 acetylase RimI-like enzyme
MNTPSFISRQAEESDLPQIVAMLSDDPLGSKRERFERPLPSSYYAAFEAIEKDQNNELVVAEGEGSVILAVLQLTFTPYITHQGGWRASIEGVRVHRHFRRSGIGRQLCSWAINRARERGCHLVQLTTDKERPRALQFYESMGFAASHEGMKLQLRDLPGRMKDQDTQENQDTHHFLG